MKATVILYQNDGSKTGLFPVKLVVTHQKKIKRKTIGKSKEADWDNLQHLPRPSHPDFEDLYGRIMDIRAKAVKRIFTQLTDLTAATDFFLGIPVVQSTCFYRFSENEISRMRKIGRNGNADAYQCAVDQLKKYSPELTFADITNHKLQLFKRKKVLDGLKNSSIRTYLCEIRALYNSAVRLNFCNDQKPFAGLFLDIPVKKRRAKNEYLDLRGLTDLKNLKNLTSAQQRAVDLSLLQFYLCGLDLVDVYYLKKTQLANNRAYVERGKLGNRSYEFDLKLFPQALAIISKYEAKKGVYVFPWRKDEDGYKTFRSNHNRCLKLVQKNAALELRPKGGFLTTKIMRHTFATMAKFKMVEVDIIRELMGHERNDIDTVYKDTYPQEVRDTAHKNIISI